MRRVVVTGIGIVSPIGHGREAFCSALARGQSGIRDITLFATDGLRARRAGEISDFQPEAFLGPKGLRLLDRAAKLALCAAHLALEDSGLLYKEDAGAEIGVCLGSTAGSVQSRAAYFATLHREGVRGLNPALFPNTVVNSPSAQVAIRFGLKGYNATISSGAASSLHALDYAARSIATGRAPAALAGGVEELGEFFFMAFHQGGCLDDGLVLGEGAAVLALEEAGAARARGARILAEYAGGGSSLALPEAVALALEEAGAAGAPPPRTFSADAVRPFIGECYSAGGAFQACAAIQALEREPRALVSSAGPTGEAAACVFSRWEKNT